MSDLQVSNCMQMKVMLVLILIFVCCHLNTQMTDSMETDLLSKVIVTCFLPVHHKSYHLFSAH